MKNWLRRLLPLLMAAVLLCGCMVEAPQSTTAPQAVQTQSTEAATEATTEASNQATEPPTETEAPSEETEAPTTEEAAPLLPEDGSYTSKEDVAEYLHLYGHLPDNFISKKEAKKQGWDGNARLFQQLFPGASIGGDYFGNYEGHLPTAPGREYHECDINFNGKSRGAERIVFSNDGLIYYTGDHYETFELLYGEE